MPRFVILEHDHPRLHWDLMLEVGAALRTWRLVKQPGKSGENIEAEPLGEHRLAYLDYEGPVSGGRGQVTRWDGGAYELLGDADHAICVSLRGQRIQGTAVVERQESGWVFRIAP
jgi:hypothetical protein